MYFGFGQISWVFSFGIGFSVKKLRKSFFFILRKLDPGITYAEESRVSTHFCAYADAYSQSAFFVRICGYILIISVYATVFLNAFLSEWCTRGQLANVKGIDNFPVGAPRSNLCYPVNRCNRLQFLMFVETLKE